MACSCCTNRRPAAQDDPHHVAGGLLAVPGLAAAAGRGSSLDTRRRSGPARPATCLCRSDTAWPTVGRTLPLEQLAASDLSDLSEFPSSAQSTAETTTPSLARRTLGIGRWNTRGCVPPVSHPPPQCPAQSPAAPTEAPPLPAPVPRHLVLCEAQEDSPLSAGPHLGPENLDGRGRVVGWHLDVDLKRVGRRSHHHHVRPVGSSVAHGAANSTHRNAVSCAAAFDVDEDT